MLTCRNSHQFTQRTKAGQCPQCQRDAVRRYQQRNIAARHALKAIQAQLGAVPAVQIGGASTPRVMV